MSDEEFRRFMDAIDKAMQKVPTVKHEPPPPPSDADVERIVAQALFHYYMRDADSLRVFVRKLVRP